jgi:hypothetical protein
MTAYFIFVGGAALFAAVVVVMDAVNSFSRTHGRRAHGARRARSCPTA